MKPKAYSYIRFSSPEQSRGDSQRRQREAATKYAAENNLDLVVDKEYQFFDEGISAYKGRNSSHEGRLKRFYDYVQNGTIESGSYLLVESLDRLSREDVLIALPRFIDLLNEGINVVTLADGITYTKGADVPQLIMSIVHMSRAHEESKIKGARVSQAWKAKHELARELKKPLGKVCPYWLSLEDGKYVVNETKSAVVNKIFTMTVNGYGQTSIVKYLNTNKVPVFGSGNRNKSGLWGDSSIAKILANRSVLGEYQPMAVINGKRQVSGDAIIDYYPSIIDENLFYSAAYARERRKVCKDSKTSESFNVWSKLIFCSKCRSPMHLVNKGKPPKGFKYFRCSSSAKGICKSKMIRFEHTEMAFKEALAMFNSLPLTNPSEKDSKNRIMELNGRIQTIKNDLNKISEILMDAPSLALSKAAQKKEKLLISCSAELETEINKKTMKTIFNKSEFFESLDLKTYEGRSSANLYLRDLDVTFRVGNNGFDSFFLAITNSSSKQQPQFSLWISADRKLRIIPFSDEMMLAVINQGELANSNILKDDFNKIIEKVEQTAGNGRPEINLDLTTIKKIDWNYDGRTSTEKLLHVLNLDKP